MRILTDGGIVTEVEPCQDEYGNDGYAVHGEPDEGFYGEDFVEVLED